MKSPPCMPDNNKGYKNLNAKVKLSRNPHDIFPAAVAFVLVKAVNRRSNGMRLLLDAEAASPPENGGGRQRSSFSSEANFDTNMVIILAALLCALICALGLNSIIRCALRCSRRFALDGPSEAAARLAATGLKKSALHQIPVVVYGASGIGTPATDCPICLGEFVDGEKVRVLPKCHHGFHVRCIDIWLASHSSCPTCRQSLLEPPPASDAAASDGELRHPTNPSGDIPGPSEEVA